MLLFAIVSAAALGLTLRALDRRFDRADRDHAVEIVIGYRPPGQEESLPALMARARDARGQQTACNAQITSSLRGTVRVTCAVDGGAPAYRFDVDLARIAIHPADAPTRRFLAALTPGG